VLILRNALEKSIMRSQSSMEYLMTYIWAILIMGVVIAALFELGVFGNSTPRAHPGSCAVVINRFGGASLSGQCTEQPPEFVAQLDGSGSYITGNVPIAGASSMTASLWVYLQASGAQQDLANFGGGSGNNQLVPYVSSTNVFHCWTNAADVSSGIILSEDKWYFLSCAYDGSTLDSYVNGMLASSGSLSGFSTSLSTFSLGADMGPGDATAGYYTNGQISNLQVYNTALSSNSISALYTEGIGGSPIDLSNLVGWWPLNGNADDYSGNGYDGNTIDISYTGSWVNAYSQP
jgi:hypothetical protein